MIAAGIDLGGTKSEVRVFDDSWLEVRRRRDDTPTGYDALVRMLAGQVRWALEGAGAPVPVGIGAAGVVDADGKVFAANLAASGRSLPEDVARAAGHPVIYVNDSRAFALSEAVFGAGRDHDVVMALVIGTGVGGGITVGGALRRGPVGIGGEFGHVPASASVVARHDLPVHRCGCGRSGCVESYVSGPGLARMARDLTGHALSPEDLSERRMRVADARKVWEIWLELVGELLLGLVCAVDPDVIVLGGGLSRIIGIEDEVSRALSNAQIEGFGVPPVVLAQGGDASGARGAALAAWQEGRHD